MFCPDCESEYRPDFTRCSDCDVDLVAELSKRQADVDLSTLKSVWSGKDQERCVGLCDKFSAAGIPFKVDQRRPQDFKGGGRKLLTAAKADVQKSLAILSVRVSEHRSNVRSALEKSSYLPCGLRLEGFWDHHEN
jgi:hypothetical protein